MGCDDYINLPITREKLLQKSNTESEKHVSALALASESSG
jgi:hypothetical protein